MESDARLFRLWFCIKVGFIGFLLVFAMAAFATPPDNRPPKNKPPGGNTDVGVVVVNATSVDAAARAGAHSDVSIGDTSVEGGSATATSGDSSVVNNSDVVVDGTGGTGGSGGTNSGSVTSSHESNFFAFSTSFPQASACFKGAQGGGGGDGGAGFFGFHWMDNDCWMSQLAEAEADAEVRALLKCHSKKFRNAVAFRVQNKGTARQEFCVNYMVEKHLAEIAAAKVAVETAVANGEISTDPK
jgi:hypothetical protein